MFDEGSIVESTPLTAWRMSTRDCKGLFPGFDFDLGVDLRCAWVMTQDHLGFALAIFGRLPRGGELPYEFTCAARVLVRLAWSRRILSWVFEVEQQAWINACVFKLGFVP